MRRYARSVVLLFLASAALSGCGPHLKKLGVCSSGPYRYANPKGVSLPSLSVPTPEDLNSPPPSTPDAGAAPNGTPPPPPSTSAPAPSGAQPAAPSPSDSVPVATPPKTGAMVLPRGSTTFGSC